MPSSTPESTPASPPGEASAAALVIVLASGSTDSAMLALRYAVTAAAMDVGVELHAISAGAAAWFVCDAAPQALLLQIRRAAEFGVQIFVCPVALADQALRPEDLIDEVSDVRGAASLLAAGLVRGARFLSF